MEANPGFLPAEFMANITVKGYLKEKTKEEVIVLLVWLFSYCSRCLLVLLVGIIFT